MCNHHLHLKPLAAVFLLFAALFPTSPAMARSATCEREGATLQLLSALSCLSVRPDYTGAYNRSAQFGSSWTDDDHDGLDTRAEVLINESTTTVVMNASGVTVRSGRWYSLYDNKVVMAILCLLILILKKLKCLKLWVAQEQLIQKQVCLNTKL